MAKRTIRTIINGVLLISTMISNAQTQNFIFDFNGVLMGTNTLASLKNIGPTNIISYAFGLKKSPFTIDKQIKTKLFYVLHCTAHVHSLDSTQSAPAYDEDGRLLPYLMRAWLDGSMTCAQVKTYVAQAIDANPQWFDHPKEKDIISNIITTIFTPDQFVNTRTIYKECITFIKTCKKHGHKVFGLSNWDTESFALLEQKYPEIFGLFDGIIISGEVHSLKPSLDIYTTLLQRYDLQPQTCWFIDDQQENVAAACQVGIHGIRCHSKKLSKKPDFKRVVNDIKQSAIVERHAAICGTTAAANQAA